MDTWPKMDHSEKDSSSVAQVDSSLPGGLWSLAVDVFGGNAEAEGWMSKPHPLLDGLTPAHCALSDAGRKAVEDMLWAIKFGGAV